MANEAGQVELGSVTKWLSGGTPNRAVDHYWSGDIPWISASTLKDAEVSSSDQCVTKEAVSLGSKMAPVNSTLLLVRGSALHNEIRAGLVVKPVCFNQDVKALIPSANVYPKFLTYSILGRQTQLLDLVSSAGNTAGVLDTKLVQAFKIWLPDVNEQRAIVTALSDVDALIAGLEKLITKKRDLKQAAMQKLLTGQTRLPEFRGEWVVKRLGDLANVAKGRGLSKGQLAGSGANPCILYGELFTTYERVISSVVSKTNSSEGLAGLRGDVLLPGSTTTKAIDLAVACALLADDVQLGGDINVVRMKSASSYDPIFMANLLTHTQKLAIADLAQGSTIIHLYGRALLNLKLKLPVITEQAAIATALSDMDTEITSLESRLAKTHELKQGMMQELLTGRTRLV